MKIKISIIAFILLSFLNIGAISSKTYEAKNQFSNLEDNISNISEFEKNGVKFQYKTKNCIEKESSRIKEQLMNNISGECKELRDNQFEIFNKDININTKMWYEGKYNYVEIILLNNNSEYSITYLKNILQKIESNEIKDTRYFLYYEGKESNENYTLDKIVYRNNLHGVKVLDINNGYVGTGYLNNGDKINFALIRYNTGSHIIIGTPIIFATY